MKYLIILFVFLSGCSTFIEHNKVVQFPDRTISHIEIKKLKGGNPKTLAYADITGDTCVIYLRKYPQCLAHEIRHCYEGNWHEGRDSSEYC